MPNFRRRLSRLLLDEHAITVSEYAVLIAMSALALMLIVTIFGSHVDELLRRMAGALGVTVVHTERP